MLKLCFPKLNQKEEILKFYYSMQKNGDSCIGMQGFENFDNWIKDILNRSNPSCVPKNKVAETFWVVCDENNDVIGVASLKHTLNDYLFEVGGHIGYAIAPNKRNRGYAKQTLKLILGEAKKLGIAEVLATCDKPNMASAKTIISCGGVLENEVYEKEENIFIQRYWFFNKE